MRRIIYRQDGGISIVIPAPKSRRKNESEQKWLDRIFNKMTPINIIGFKDIDEKINPLPNRRFRNAWSKGSRGIKVSLAKAKKQVLSEIRTVRDEELTRTDGLMARANEIGTQTEIDELKIYRQKLRDLPMKVENITTIKKLQEKYPKIATIQDMII